MLQNENELKREDYEELYFNKLRNIAKVKIPITWNKTPQKLTCCIVEPRIINTLHGVLNNVAAIYGNSDVGLTIFHGNHNKKYILNIIKNWKNVNLINMNVDNLKIEEYSRMLTQKSFYKNFTSSHILIFQWDSYIFKKIPDYYYNFDFVGARWQKNIGNNCGNGGISLRNRIAMIKHSTINGVTSPEDFYFAKRDLQPCDNVANHTLFSCEGIFAENPYCCHKPFASMTDPTMQDEYITFLNNIK